ncbi:hypothetical protein GCM10008967_13000 [Bacillus carboniphilus]|uniref:Uncharacterized protein n=1 Tax=Bacillus carboniphilus TaxID=86663 RepID=A0ABP3FUC6_9BACI
MDSQLKQLYGSWIQAIGTIVAAIGSTPNKYVTKEFLDALELWGNVLQATGNALEADGGGEELEVLGNEIQAIGNVTVVAGLVLHVEKNVGQRLEITGNWLQALGGGVALGAELDEERTPSSAYIINGNLLQSIGNSMQAISGIYELREDGGFQTHPKIDSQTLEVSGSWIQAVGSVLTLIGQIKES